MSTTPRTKTKNKGGDPRPYNRYNIYFVLERERLILSKGGSTKWQSEASSDRKLQLTKQGYEKLNLPPLPPRFAHLDVPDGWYIPGQQKKRPHRRTHGVATFREIAQSIAASWKDIDDLTLQWCTAVEKLLKQKHDELRKENIGPKISSDIITSQTESASSHALNDIPPSPTAVNHIYGIESVGMDATQSNQMDKTTRNSSALSSSKGSRIHPEKVSLDALSASCMPDAQQNDYVMCIAQAVIKDFGQEVSFEDSSVNLAPIEPDMCVSGAMNCLTQDNSSSEPNFDIYDPLIEYAHMTNDPLTEFAEMTNGSI